MRDEGLRQFATEREWEILEAYWEAGSERKAAAKLGSHHSLVSHTRKRVERKAAKQGYSPKHDFTRVVPDGFQLKGTSTLYDKDGNLAAQWVKTTRDGERQAEMMREAIAAFSTELPRAEPVPKPQATSAHLLAAYPVGDHHFGMYAWKEEAGDDYDLEIAEKLLFGAFDYLIASAPPAGVGLIVLLGDFLHYDSMVPVTPTNRNQLDADSRFPKMVRTAIRAIRYAIKAALSRHEKVRVIVEIGNHDLASSIFLMECLANVYENEPRVEIDTSPKHFHYYEFGKNLIGTHHGDNVKLESLPITMATDRPEAWGRTQYRFIWTCHTHKDRVIDPAGARVESFRVLGPTDAWADKSGYRSSRSMTGIVLHKEFGEVARNTVNPAMLQIDSKISPLMESA
jgi:hypothetical protein